MSTKFDEYPDNRNMGPEEEKKFNAKIILAFIVGAFLAVIGFMLKAYSLSALGCLVMCPTGFYLLAVVKEIFQKSKQEENEQTKKRLEELKKENNKEKYEIKNEEEFDIKTAIIDEFGNEVDLSAINKNIIIFHKQSNYLFDIYLKLNFTRKSMQLYCPFFYPKSFNEITVGYGAYLEKLHEHLNKLNIKYIAYKFFTENTMNPVGLVIRDYPLIDDESVINFLKEQINLMLKVLDEVYAEMPKDYI